MTPLASYVARLATGEFGSVARRMRRKLIGYSVIAILFAIAIVFLLASAHTALAAELGSIHAALVMAAGFMVLGGAIWIGLGIVAARERARARARASSQAALGAAAAATLLPHLMKSRNALIAAVPLAIVAYLLLSDKDPDPDQD